MINELEEITKKTIVKALTGVVVGCITYKVSPAGAFIMVTAIEVTSEIYFEKLVDTVTDYIKDMKPVSKGKWPKGKRLAFIGINESAVSDKNCTVVQLNLKNSVWNSDDDWATTVAILKLAKNHFTQNAINESEKGIIIDCKGFSLSGGVLVGYTFHRNTHLSVFFQDANKKYGSSKNITPIPFRTETTNAKFSSNEKNYIDLCVYVHAKRDYGGNADFERYIEEETGKQFENPHIVRYIGEVDIDESTDLATSAKYISREIEMLVEELEKLKYKERVRVHLFLNSFLGFATLLGTQFTQNVPICLYDFFGTERAYKPMIVLSSDLLNS